MNEFVFLIEFNVCCEFKGIFCLVCMVVGLVFKIKYGLLDIIFFDGCCYLIEGVENGFCGVLKIYDWCFFFMVVNKGDVGVGEVFMVGYWLFLDVIIFLEVFCINQVLIMEVL